MNHITGEVSKKLIEYFGTDVRRINHAMKVAAFAKSIGENEGLDQTELFIIEACGYLHDVGIKKGEELYQSAAGSYQEEFGPDIVRELLKDTDIRPNILDRICYIIGNHHSYQKINGLDFQILVEADFIVNACEDQMNEANIRTVYERIFKTKTGRMYLEKMYFTVHLD
jgi:HD superfamily phosphodiesterase